MKKILLEEIKITETIEAIPENSFTILDFMETFKNLFPEKWSELVSRFGLFGKKKRYTVATYLSNRLYSYSQKENSLLKTFQKYKKGRKGDHRKATKEERKVFVSPWIAAYQKIEKKEIIL